MILTLLGIIAFFFLVCFFVVLAIVAYSSRKENIWHDRSR